MSSQHTDSLHNLHGLHLHPEQMLVVGWDELGQTGDVSGDVCCRRLQDGRVPLPGAGGAAHGVEALAVIVDDVVRFLVDNLITGGRDMAGSDHWVVGQVVHLGVDVLLVLRP